MLTDHLGGYLNEIFKSDVPEWVFQLSVGFVVVILLEWVGVGVTVVDGVGDTLAETLGVGVAELVA